MMRYPRQHRHLWLALTSLLSALWPSAAFAQIGNLGGIVGSIASGKLTSLPGTDCGIRGGGFLSIALEIYGAMAPLFWILAILMIVIFGIRMIIGQEDDILDKSRPVMTAIIGALILANLLLPLLEGIYGCTGENVATTGATNLAEEIYGVIEWALVLAAPLAVLVIIVTALRAMLSPSDDSIGLMKRCLGAVLVGMVLLAFHMLIGDRTVDNNDPFGALVQVAIQVLNYVVQFMALAAVIMIVYAGFRLILSLGNSDALSQARSLIVRVAIGAILILFAYVIVTFLVNPLVS